MLGFLKKKPSEQQTPSQNDEDPIQPAVDMQANNVKDVNDSTPSSIFTRLKNSLSKTRGQLAAGINRLLFGKKTIDAELLKAIETQLLQADVGVTVTKQLIQSLTQKLDRAQLTEPQALLNQLQIELTQTLEACQNASQASVATKPIVVLVVGVNGAGKTTTIGKLAHHYQTHGKRVMLAAGDTFRAAAIEQLKIWGDRSQIPVIAQQIGADSASVIFDAFNAAKARGVDYLIADTAGRLHTKQNLMEELKKIKRVLAKLDPTAPHETLLVLDATIGQNAIAQAEQFHAAIGLTGLIVTKLDGTAKGGIVFAIAKSLNLPIQFIGTGENLTDLAPFNAQDYVQAIFGSVD